LGSQETVNQTTSCQHKLSKQLVQHIGEVRVRIEIKHLYPCINMHNKIWVLV